MRVVGVVTGLRNAADMRFLPRRYAVTVRCMRALFLRWCHLPLEDLFSPVAGLSWVGCERTITSAIGSGPAAGDAGSTVCCVLSLCCGRAVLLSRFVWILLHYTCQPAGRPGGCLSAVDDISPRCFFCCSSRAPRCAYSASKPLFAPPHSSALLAAL